MNRYAIAAVAAALALCACPDKNANPAPATPGSAAPAEAPKASTSRLDKVKSSKKVAIGIGYTVPPMNYIDDRGVWTGFDMDLAKEVVKKLAAKIPGLEAEYVKVDSKTRVLFLATGRIDMAISSMSHTRGRDETIDYAEPPYLWVGKQFYAKAGAFKDMKDLVGKRIAVQQGSNAFTAGADALKGVGDANPNMVAFQTDGDAFLALKQGKVDAFTQDNVILLGIMGADGKDYAPVGTVYSPGLYGIGVPPNDSSWRDAISFALQDVMKDGSYETIYTAWFGPQGKFPLATDARPRLPADAYGAGQLMIWPD